MRTFAERNGGDFLITTFAGRVGVRAFIGQTIWLPLGLSAVLVAGGVGLLAWKLQARHRRLADTALREKDQSATLVRLAHSPAVARGDVEQAFAEATEAAAHVLGVSGVGIWLLDDAGHEFRCADLFEAACRAHAMGGSVIRVPDHPRYFASLRNGRVVDVADATRDPRTDELAPILPPDGGRGVSALHATIRVSGELVGVVRHEQAGARRVWRDDEVAFAAAHADQIAQILSNARRERALRESEKRFRLVVESVPNGMIMVNGQGHIGMVNAAIERVFGYRRQALIGRPLGMLLPEPYDARRTTGGEPGFEPSLGTGKASGGYETYGRRADGREIPLEVVVNALETADGPFVLCSITDLSERKRAEFQAVQLRNELAHLSRVTMLGELSGSLAHELNQPLTSILSNAQAAQHFLAGDDPDFGEVGEILADIVAEDKRAGEVIRRLRALFKKGDVQREVLDLNEVLDDVLKLARSDLINQGVAVDERPTRGLPPVTGDRVQLQQVLLNLVKNGCDAMADAGPDERKLDLSTGVAADGAGVRVSICDRGSGVPPGDFERVFEPFFTTKSGGMGLGLAVCRSIVQGHDGRLWIENNADCGATVHLVLPTTRYELAPAAHARDRREARPGALDQSLIVSGRTAG